MVLVNGEPADTISIYDRALHYGDGLFETIAVIDGEPQRWDRHMARLQTGAQRLGLPAIESGRLHEETLRVCRDSARAVVKLIVSRGSGPRGYRATRHQGAVTRIIMMTDWPEYPEYYYTEGIRLRLCDTRLGWNPQLAGIKHLNRLEQVLARSEWYDPEIPEGLMQDQAGQVIEGTQSNIFIVCAGCLLTPALTQCGVAGVMREHIIEMAGHLHIPVSETTLSLTDIHKADEVFMSNTLIGIWPVRLFEGSTYALGPVCRRLLTGIATPRRSITDDNDAPVASA